MVIEGHASGWFEVTLTPADPPGPANRLLLAKTFGGELAGTSVGEMLSAGDPRAGAAGYVAIEQVMGTLDGRDGGFALQHSGTMVDGAEQLSVTVVPGSSTGGLAGLTGCMTLRRDGGRHVYAFSYRLP